MHSADPVCVAAYCGFKASRGLAPGTIKIAVQHTKSMAIFYFSHFCPRGRGVRLPTPEEQERIQQWFKQLSAKTLIQFQREPKKRAAIHLWEAWDFAISDWYTFLKAFQVGGWLPAAHLHSSSPSPQACCVQDNKYEYDQNLAVWCQTAVLRILLCGLWQPPIRAGALRILHTSNGRSTEQPCGCEKCK